MAAGLEAAHTATDHRQQPMRIVHRDVSPQNVFLSWAGAVKIGDFGIASAKNKLHNTTEPGTIKGKYGYMSPEQTLAAKVDARADIWATGVVLWEMLVGARLFATDSPVDTIGRVNEMPIKAPSEHRGGIDPELDEIVMGALQRPLTLRTKTAGDLAAALDTYINGRFGAGELEALLPSWGLSRATYHAARVRGRGVPRQSPKRQPTEAEFAAWLQKLECEKFWAWLEDTDNATHFKSKEMLHYWSTRMDATEFIKMVWVEFGCPGHGKGPWDGLGAMVKTKVSRDLTNGQVLTPSGDN